MYCWVAYDISSNRVRLRISKACRRIGLLRYQKSVFLGRVGAEELRSLEQEWRLQLAPTDKLAVLPLDKRAFRLLLQQTNDARIQRMAQAFVFREL